MFIRPKEVIFRAPVNFIFSPNIIVFSGKEAVGTQKSYIPTPIELYLFFKVLKNYN